jgi:N-acyl-D-aspartate/D-glutamate deacylase
MDRATRLLRRFSSALLVTAAIGALSVTAQTIETVVSAGTIYTSPDQPPLHAGVIVLKDGRIAFVGKAAPPLDGRVQFLDCPTCTVTAGFWNVHVHFIEQKWADATHQPAASLQAGLDDMLLGRGFTTIADLASTPRTPCRCAAASNPAN